MRKRGTLMLAAIVWSGPIAAQPNEALRKVEIAPPTVGQLNQSCWDKATAGIGLESALADCNAALAIEPENSNIIDSRALVLLRLGRFDDAIADYDRALAAEPFPPESRFGRAVARARKGDRAVSEADMKAALKSDPQVAARFESFGIKLGLSSNAEMTAIFNADQADRANWVSVDKAAVAAADKQRRAQTQALLDAGLLVSGEDFLHAAFLFQHGEQPEDYLKAHILGTVALARGEPRGAWIASATLDRYLQTIGKPQVMGTQYQFKDGKALQDPYDPKLIPDALRQAMHVPTLAEQAEHGRSMMRDMGYDQGDCRGIAGISVVAENRLTRWLVVGEAHGTAETPAIFADLVCLVASTGRPIVVAVEQSADDQPAIDAYLASDGRDKARAALLAAKMWHYPMKDGRSSQAHLALFERLRQLKADRKIAGVVAFQPGSASIREPTPQAYEQAMADIVRRASTAPDILVVALVGNIHASLAKVDFGTGGYMPMAGLLPQSQTVTLNAVGNGGGMWACMGDATGKPVCGAHESAMARTEPRGIQLRGAAPPRYSGTLNLGVRTTASPPAAID